MPENEDLEVADLEKELEAIREQEKLMNDRKLAIIDQQRQAMRRKEAQLAAGRAEVARRDREAELEKQIEVRACDFLNGLVNVKILPDMRSDVLEVLRNTPGRQFDAYAVVNRIPIESWPALRDNLKAHKNLKVTHLLGVDQKIDSYFSAPLYEVKLKDKYFLVIPHPTAFLGVFASVPGQMWYHEHKYWNIPLSEGWRLFELLEQYKDTPRGVRWETKALDLVRQEIERRQKLDSIALLKDTELTVNLKNGELKPFQKVGVKFFQLSNGRALNADQMGLGKTWQDVAYSILMDFEMSVIVCPAHLKANWSREIWNLTGEFAYICQGREPDKHDVETFLLKRPKYIIINYDILAAKTTIPKREYLDDKGRTCVEPEKERWLWADLINMAKPNLVTCDEAHYIKNTTASRSKAVRALTPEHRIALTGTPILNRPGEFFAVLNWLRPEIFPSEEKFLNQYTVGGKHPKNLAELRDLLKPIMIRRLKKDVVAELPPINRIDRFYELSSAERAEYKKVLEGVYYVIDKAGNKVEQNITSILAEIQKLKEVCARAAVPYTVELAQELYDTEQDVDDAKGGAKKVIIFSFWKDTVRKIATALGANTISWTGDTSLEERTKLEYRFQNDPSVHFLVVSLMTGQTGLNLTAAGHVIFNDLYWTPAAHQQAEERAYGRLSDMHGADSYYQAAEDTICAWIQEMLTGKQGMINATVEGINDERNPSIGMAIIQRLKEAMGRA